MRLINLAVLMFIMPAIAFAQMEQYVVSGNIKGCEDGEVSLTIWVNGETVNGVTEIKNGKFELKGECDSPQMIRASFKDKKVYKYVSDGGYIPYKCSSLWFLVYPGANVKVKGSLSDFVDAYPNDKSENKLLASLTKKIFPLMNEVGNISVKMDNKEYAPGDITKYAQIADAKNREMMEIQKRFVMENASSYAAIWFIDDMLLRKQLTPTEAESIIKNIDKKYHSLAWFKGIEQRIGSVKYSVGNIMPEITSANSSDNTPFSSKTTLGKYLIIDFWGTWCGPCMSGMDSMRDFKEKHKDNLEILGIASDKRDGWLKAIQDKNLCWLHILNGKGEEDYVAKFNVTGYPTKILVSPKGEILYRESGESEAFYREVEKLMQGK